MVRQEGSARRLLLIFGVLSLAAVSAGAAVCALSGVPAALWIRNLAAWVVGAAAAAGVAATYRPAFASVALWTAPIGLAAAFLGPEQLGVHRWIGFGPVVMNAALLLLPAAAVGLAATAKKAWSWAPALVSLLLLAAQPDASQAMAMGSVIALVAAFSIMRPSRRWAVTAAAGLIAALACLRPDPLQPVPEVEELLGLAHALSPLAAIGTSLLLLAAASTPMAVTSNNAPAGRLASASLTLCLLIWTVAPFVGAFPVPFAGIGVSPILGAWLGVGLLAALLRKRCAPGP